MDQKISIIGGSGFIGTHLCQLLTNNEVLFEIIDLRPSDRFPDKCKIGDVRDAESLRDLITGQIVVNLAAVHSDDVTDLSQYHKTNVIGAENVIMLRKAN